MKTTREAVPLHSVEAERSALGAMFFGDRAADEVEAIVRPEDFFLDAHRKIFSIMRRIRYGKAVDPVVLKRELIAKGMFDGVGGEEALIRLMEDVPSPSNAARYAQIVKENAVLREMEARAFAFLRELRDDRDTSAKIAQAQAIGDGLSMSNPVRHISAIDLTYDHQGVTTGFDGLDGITDTRGWPDEQIGVIQADTNVGKTAMAIGCLVSALEAGHRCLYATFADLNAEQLAKRILRNLTGRSRRPSWTPNSLEGHLELEQQQQAFDAAAEKLRDPLGGYDLEVYDATDLATGYDIETFLSWLHMRQKQDPFRIVFIDYAQELSSRDRVADGMVAQMVVCAQKVNRAARALKIPIVVLSQVTTVDGQSKTMYSRAWEQKAGMVVEISRDQDDLHLKKNRFGPKGQHIPVILDKTHVKFIEA